MCRITGSMLGEPGGRDLTGCSALSLRFRQVSGSCPAASPVHPDGGEARVKRKGGTARDRLKEARSEIAIRRTGTGYEAAPAGRAGTQSRSPYPSKAGTVNPTDVRGRTLGLPQEICIVSDGNPAGLRGPQGRLTTAQKSAEGVVGRLGG